MASLIQDAFKRGGDVHMVSQKNPHEHVQIGKLKLPMYSNHIKHRRCQTSTMNPSSQPSNALTSNQFTDFKVAGVDDIRNITLAMTYTVNDAFAATPVAITPEMVIDTISHIETIGENGSNVLTRVDGTQLLLSLSNVEAYVYHACRNGITGASSAGVPLTLDAGETGTVYLPIFDNILSNFNIPASGLNHPIIIRVWYKAGSYLSTTLLYEISNIMLLVDSWVYDTSVQQETLAKYQSQSLHFRFSNQLSSKSVENVTPNVNFIFKLTGLTGMVTSMTVIFKTIGDNTIRELKKLDLLSPSGASLLGGTHLEHKFLQMSQRPRDNRYVPSSTEPVLSTDLWFRVPISEESAAHNNQGSVNGYLPMSGQHQLSLYYESASSTSLPCEITVLYNCVSVLTINKGRTEPVQLT